MYLAILFVIEAIDIYACMCVCVRGCFSLVTLWTVARQVPLFMGFSRQEYWSGLPFPSSGDLPNPGIEPGSPVSSALQVDCLLLSHWGNHTMEYYLAIRRNEIGSFVEMWMDLESAIQNALSQKDKNRYQILKHICGTQKNGTDEPIFRVGKEMQM